MNTDAAAGCGLSASGLRSGTTRCTRAVTTPSMFASVFEISCDIACSSRACSSSGDDTKPSRLNTLPMVSNASFGRPWAFSTWTARGKSPLAVSTEKWPSCDCFSASMPAPRSAATISLAWRSVSCEYSSWREQAASRTVSVHPATRARRRREGRVFMVGSGLLAEQLRQAVGGAVGDVRGELAMEHELLAAHRQHHHLARGHLAAGVLRGVGIERELLRLAVDVLERLHQLHGGLRGRADRPRFEPGMRA